MNRMKWIFFLLTVACFVGCTHIKSTNTSSVDTLLNKVVVQNLDLNLDAKQKTEHSPLWDNFGSKPYHKMFDVLTTENWNENRIKFENRLLELAEKQHLEVDSLRKILSESRPPEDSQSAVIPVGAYRAMKGSDPVWIVIFKWEGLSGSVDLNEALPLIHYSVGAFRISDGKCVSSASCG